MGYSDHQVEQVREQADIVAIIGRRVQLKKTGKDHRGLCPFHGERTPSFDVIPGKQMWHCFGCDESGDVFRFFMKLDGMPFPEAVRHVAQEAGIPLVEEQYDPEEARRRKHLDDLALILERATQFYERKLWHGAGQVARNHLSQRGIGDEIARKFHLGFGGGAMDDLARALAKAGASEELAVEAGLCLPNRDGRLSFDRFHGRLIVPIRVPRPPDGRTVALGGRFLEGVTNAAGSRRGRKHAKYINSPETPLYQKGSVLFGLDQARDAIRKDERAVVVEGYFDVIALHQAGLPLAVASCGTSLTQNHLDLLTRSAARDIIFLFDGDPAGLRAAARAAEMCALARVPARVATLPDGLDPDEFARQRGLDGLKALLDRAKPVVDMLIDHSLRRVGVNATVEEQVRAVQAVRNIVMAVPDSLTRELYFEQISRRIGLKDVAHIKSAFERTEPAAGSEALNRAVGPPPPAVSGVAEPTEEDAPEEAVAADRESVEFLRRAFQFAVRVVAGLLRYPELAPLVAKSEALADFRSTPLRRIGERIIHRQADPGAVPGDHLFEGVGPQLREVLEREKLQLAEETLEHVRAQMEKIIRKLRWEAHRENERLDWLFGPKESAGDDGIQEALRRGQAGLELARQLHPMAGQRATA